MYLCLTINDKVRISRIKNKFQNKKYSFELAIEHWYTNKIQIMREITICGLRELH